MSKKEKIYGFEEHGFGIFITLDNMMFVTNLYR